MASINGFGGFGEEEPPPARGPVPAAAAGAPSSSSSASTVAGGGLAAPLRQMAAESAAISEMMRQTPLPSAEIPPAPAEIDVAYVKTLIRLKDAADAEIEQLTAWLTAPGRPGLSGGLIDADGYPLSDVQLILTVRESRGRLAMLKNDAQQLVEMIERGLEVIHAAARERKAAATPAGATTTTTTTPSLPAATLAAAAPPQSQQPPQQQQPPPPPFARVNSVADGSPAAAAGLRAGDGIARFGTVQGGGGATAQQLLALLPGEVAGSVGRPLALLVVRGDQHEAVALSLTPQRWSGQGYLGCHLLPAA